MRPFGGKNKRGWSQAIVRRWRRVVWDVSTAIGYSIARRSSPHLRMANFYGHGAGRMPRGNDPRSSAQDISHEHTSLRVSMCVYHQSDDRSLFTFGSSLRELNKSIYKVAHQSKQPRDHPILVTRHFGLIHHENHPESQNMQNRITTHPTERRVSALETTALYAHPQVREDPSDSP